MNIKRRLTCALMAALPSQEQEAMVRSFIDWLFSDLTPEERQVKFERIGPRLTEWISEGKVGLSLVLFQHIYRLKPVQALYRWAYCPWAQKDETVREIEVERI